VNVGKQGTLQGIQGVLNIEMPDIKQGLNTIHIDDSSEPSPLQDVVLGTFRGDNDSLWGYVQGLAPANINYKYDDTQSLTIDTGSGGDRLAVQTTGTDTTLNLGDGTNLVNVTPYDNSSSQGYQAQNLDFLGGNLTVNGGTGSNTLVLDDVANTNQSTWTFTGDSVSRTYVPQNGGDLGPPVTRTVNYSAIGTIRIEASSGGNEFDLAPLQQNLADLPASLDLQAAGGSTTLNLFDQNDRTPLDWTVTGSEIDRFTQGGVTVLLGSVTFSPLSSLTIYGGTGPSEFDLSPVNQNLDELPHTTITPLGTDQGSVTVHGGGADTLILDDQNNTQASAWTITGTTVTRAYTLVDGLFLQTVISSISYTGLADLTVNGGPGGNLVGIHDTAAATNTTVNSGNGVDFVYVFATTGPLAVNTQQGGPPPGVQHEGVFVGGPVGAAGTLDTIQGPLTINTVGRPNMDFATVALLDMATTTPETYTVTSDTVLRSGAAPIHYRVTNELEFHLGRGGNTVNIQSTFPGLPDVFVGGLGNDTFNVGDSANTLNGIQSHLYFQIANAGSQVVLHDEGNASPVNYTFSYDPGISSSHWMQRSDSGYYILYSGLLQNLVLNTGSGSHIINVKNTPAPTTVTIHSSGQDTVNIGNGTDGVGDIQGSVNITNNSAAGDSRVTLHGPDVNSVWQISGAGAGVLDTQVHFAGIQNLVGGQASDSFVFRSGSSIAGTIDGGAGTNTLDYSRYTGNVMVDLPLGLASLVNQMAPSSISNIQNVTGSQGNDLLVCDANVNALVGGTGRNVLIGGNGPDTLDAHVSHDDNILIGGRTDWDINLAALQAVMAEWNRTDLNFHDRRSDLLNGTNGQGAVPLNMVNGQLILLKPATNPTSSNGTVHADGVKDILIGTNAINPVTGRRAHNWFFYETLDVLMNFLSRSDRKDRVT
jgi:hypothetical protein